MKLEDIKRVIDQLLGRDIQPRITREYRRALGLGSHDFPARIALPVPCARGLPERVVELLAARLSYRPGLRVLDVGHAYIMQCHRDLLRDLPEPRDLTGIDIAEPIFDASAFYTASVRGSVTDMGFSDATFDLVWCISALEHFGMDNSGYTREFVVDESMAARAMEEMLRVLRPGGTLLVTLPFGRYENHRWFRNFDSAHLETLIAPARRLGTLHELYFRHAEPGGWQAAEPGTLGGLGYGDEKNAGASACVVVVVVKNGGEAAS
jgi:SAM-dependent methyltransferase